MHIIKYLNKLTINFNINIIRNIYRDIIICDSSRNSPEVTKRCKARDTGYR